MCNMLIIRCLRCATGCEAQSWDVSFEMRHIALLSRCQPAPTDKAIVTWLSTGYEHLNEPPSAIQTPPGFRQGHANEMGSLRLSAVSGRRTLLASTSLIGRIQPSIPCKDNRSAACAEPARACCRQLLAGIAPRASRCATEASRYIWRRGRNSRSPPSP